MTGSEYLRFLLVPLSFMVVFYTNYFLLIERYLFTVRQAVSWAATRC